MLDLQRVNQMATDIAIAHFERENVSRVVSDRAVDSAGDEALRIMIVFTGKSIPPLSGEAIIANLSQLSDELQRNADERFPILEYATEEELANERAEDE